MRRRVIRRVRGVALSHLARVTHVRGQFDRRLRGESGREERDDSDGGREQGRVTGNPSDALVSLFNYRPSLAVLITPTHVHTHTSTCVRIHALGSCAEVILLHKVYLGYVGGFSGLGTVSLDPFSAADP